MFKENKYTKWYWKIIEKAQKEIRVKTKNSYYESHHIIPKSLNGSNEKENLVLLTAREHFICHLLLTKMCKEKKHYYQMCWALHKLCFSTYNTQRKFTSYQYELARKTHSRNMSVNSPNKKKENRIKISQRVTKDWENNEKRKLAVSIQSKNRWANNQYREEKTKFNKEIAKLSWLKQKENHKIEYKGSVYYGYSELFRKTGINQFLYELYYLKNEDPEKWMGRLGPICNKKWINNTIEEFQWNVVDYSYIPVGYSFGRLKRKEVRQ